MRRLQIPRKKEKSLRASLSSSKACYDKCSMKRRAWTSWWTIQYGPSPMIASKVFIQIEEYQERTSSMPSLWEIKIYSCANNYWSTLHTSSCIENMENLVNYSIWTLSHHCFKGLYVKLEILLVKLIFVYERDIVVGIW